MSNRPKSVTQQRRRKRGLKTAAATSTAFRVTKRNK